MPMGTMFWLMWAPLSLLAFGLAGAVLFQPNSEPFGLLVGVGFMWLLFTGNARKIYWNSRLRTRASMDERRARGRVRD